MKIELTNHQYLDLIRLLYLSNWMINSLRTGQPGDKRIEKYEPLEQHIFSFAQSAEAGDYIQYDQYLKKLAPTVKLEDDPEIRRYIDEHDDGVFWDELVARMATRDFFGSHKQKEIEQMHPADVWDRLLDLEEKYWQEFESHGVENLGILKIENIS